MGKMGNCCRKNHPESKIVLLLLGLDNAGKTVAAKHLAGQNTEEVMPTVGFSVVDLKYSSYNISVYDLGGKSDFRDVWERYYSDAHGIIFVIDSSDYDRMYEAHSVLENIMTNDKIKGKPVLLLANKQDNEDALDEIDLIEKLELETLANDNECPTLIQTCCANNTSKLDKGIKIGYNWLINCIIKEYAVIDERVQTDMDYQEKIDESERIEKMLRLRYLNELEKGIEIEAETNKSQPKPISNGIKDVFITQTQNKNKPGQNPFEIPMEIEAHVEIESISTTSSSDSEPVIYYNMTQRETRPKSATSLISRQLQLDNLQRKPSFRHFTTGNNRTVPVQLYGTGQENDREKVERRIKAPPKSATVRSVSGNKLSAQRNLRSAGDSVFIVSDASYKVMPNNEGSGDLHTFTDRQFTTNGIGNCNANNGKTIDVLPPINNVQSVNIPHSRHRYRLENGYF